MRLTEMASGADRVGRVDNSPERLRVAVLTVTFRVSVAQPVALAVMTAEPAAWPSTRYCNEVAPAGTLTLSGTVSLVVSELDRLTVSGESIGALKDIVRLRCM